MNRLVLLISLPICLSIFLLRPVYAMAQGIPEATAGEQRGETLLATASMPTDGKAAKSYARAMKDFNERRLPAALDGFQKADQMSGGRCVACEVRTYRAAIAIGGYQAAREETALLLQHVSSDADKAEVHGMTGGAWLAEAGFRIYTEPFQSAHAEFKAALQLTPDRADLQYEDGMALAHLHQYDEARQRFEQYVKSGSPKDPRFRRAKLFLKSPELARKRMAPDFRVTSLDGKTLSLQELQGKVVLLDFWATWCVPCRNALPHLREIVHKFEGQPLVVVSVNLDEDQTPWKSFVAQNGMSWTQYWDGGFQGPIATAFVVKAIPTTFTIDKDGFVQDQQVGDGEIERKLKDLVSQAASDDSKTLAELR